MSAALARVKPGRASLSTTAPPAVRLVTARHSSPRTSGSTGHALVVEPGGDPVAVEPVADAGRRQLEAPRRAVPAVRAGQQPEGQLEVLCRAGHRAADGEVGLRERARQVRGSGRGRARSRSSACARSRRDMCDGRRIEPPMSLPSSSGVNRQASAAAEPPDEPPAVRVRS